MRSKAIVTDIPQSITSIHDPSLSFNFPKYILPSIYPMPKGIIASKLHSSISLPYRSLSRSLQLKMTQQKLQT